jgi:dye decolorizing peroxidase
MTADRNRSDRTGSTRRQFLVGGAVAGVGAAAAIGIDLALTTDKDAAPAASGSTPQDGTEIVPFYGVHQAGIDTAAQT